MNADRLKERFEDRMRRTADEAAAQGFDALVVAPSPDLAYLTGYDPMPLERPTPARAARRTGRRRCSCPSSNAPLAAASPAGAGIELVGWTDGVDPVRGSRASSCRTGHGSAVGDRLWAESLLGLQRAVPEPRSSPRRSVHRAAARRQGR